MKETPEGHIVELMENHKQFFSLNKTKDVGFRLKQLRKLKRAILENPKQIEDALWEDLHKSPEESYLTEISIVICS